MVDLVCIIAGGVAFALVWTRGLATIELFERIKRGERPFHYWESDK